MWADIHTGRWEDDFIEALLGWLGYDGVGFFRMCIQEYGTTAPVWNRPSGIPHPVHFREGMDVRNAMRRIHRKMGIPVCGAHFYDNHWQSAVQAAIKMCEEGVHDHAKVTDGKA